MILSNGQFRVTLQLVRVVPTSRVVAVSVATVWLYASAARADPPTPRKARSALPAPTRAKPTRGLARTDGPVSTPTAKEKLVETLKQVLGHRALARGTTAIYAVDAATGEEIFSINADKKLNPASNVKLFSTATTLDLLGSDFRYDTRLIGPSPDHAGTVDGDIYLLGSADPTFMGNEVDALVADLAARGVKKITGRVVLSDDRYRDVLGIPRIKVVVRGASRSGREPTVDVYPQNDFVKLEVTAKTTRRRRARPSVRGTLIDGDDGEKLWQVTVAGHIGRRSRRVYRLGAPLRSTFTAHVVHKALLDAGIAVDGGVALEPFADYVSRSAKAGQLPVELAVHRSAPLRDLVRMTNKRSINYMADRLVMTAATHERGGNLSMDSAVETMYEFFERVGIQPSNLNLDTGSGLSYKTELTTKQIVRMLRVGAGYVEGTRGDTEAFRASLSIGGVDGTLRHRLLDSEVRGKVIGKTGTLTRCIALSGFVKADNGRTIAFSIVSNGHRRRDRTTVRSEHELLVEALYHFAAATPLGPAAPTTAVAADTPKAAVPASN